MEIIDKYGYLESALGYIEKNIIAGRNFQKLAKKSGVGESLLRKLSQELRGFSEKHFLTSLQEKLEERHSSLGGVDAELTFADIGIEVRNNKALVLIYFKWALAIDGESEDKAKMSVEILSKNKFKIEII